MTCGRSCLPCNSSTTLFAGYIPSPLYFNQTTCGRICLLVAQQRYIYFLYTFKQFYKSIGYDRYISGRKFSNQCRSVLEFQLPSDNFPDFPQPTSFSSNTSGTPSNKCMGTFFLTLNWLRTCRNRRSSFSRTFFI